MPLLLLVILLFSFLAAILAINLFIQKTKEKGFFQRGMDLALFLVTLPQEVKKESQTSLKEHLKISEQFFNSLSGFKEKRGFWQRLIGNPVFVFEIAVHRIGEEIHFYCACPRALAQTLEKQILAFWPQAQVQPSLDYNIFNPKGSSLAARAYLKRLSLLPLKSPESFESDPLALITAVLTRLQREGEGAAIQFLVRPSSRSLAKTSQKLVGFLQEGKKLKESLNLLGQEQGLIKFLDELTKLFSAGQEKEKQKEKEKLAETRPLELSPLQKELIASIETKGSLPLFDLDLRILASTGSKERSQQLLGQLENSFEQLGSPFLNQMGFQRPEKTALDQLFYRFSFRIFEESPSLLVSSQELACLFHWPLASWQIPHIKWLKTKQAPAPPNLPEQGIIIGKNVFRTESRLVRLLADDRRRHLYIVGQTGTGKSVLLEEMARQDMESGHGLCVLDPHGSLAETLLEVVPRDRVKQVIYFNPADSQRPLGLNMLEYDPNFPEAKGFLVNELLEIFEKLYDLKAKGFGGPIFEQYMRNALLLVMEDPKSGNTLIEVPRVLSDVHFRKYKLSRCQNLVVKNFWELEAEKAGGEAALANLVPYITSKLNAFVANDLIRPIISQQYSSFNFREIMDNSQILIVNLSKGRLGDINSYLLGMIIVGRILIAAFSRTDLPEGQRKDFYLYIDEFHNVTTKTIATALAEARKFRLNMVLAHQYIGQLDEDAKKAIFGNVGSLLAFRMGPDDAKYLVTQFEPVFDENDLVNFDNYLAAFRLLIQGQTTRPFNITTFPAQAGEKQVADFIKEFSRRKYGRDQKQVELELYQRLKRSTGVRPL